MRIFTLILSIVVLILFIIFIILNGGEVVDLHFLGIEAIGISLPIVVLFSFLAGAFFALIIGVASEIRLRNRLKKMDQENKRLRNELISLRNLPVEEETGEG